MDRQSAAYFGGPHHLADHRAHGIKLPNVLPYNSPKECVSLSSDFLKTNG